MLGGLWIGKGKDRGETREIVRGKEGKLVEGG